MTFETLLQALRQPEIYPESTTSVDVRETHISVVFLTDCYAYKIKKPCRLGFLDYSTLERRHFYCTQELLLNRRLSSGVYLAVVPIHFDGKRYAFSGHAPIVEYALKMRRLPEAATLEALLKHQAVSLGTMRQVAHRLVTFHSMPAASGRMSGFGTRAQVLADWQENFEQTRDCVGNTLSQSSYTRIEVAVDTFTTRRAAWFQQRVEAGCIRDCHGDLRAEHVYLEGDVITIIDCIEFNERLRYIDVVSEVAFLAMDMERLGFPDLAHGFVQSYVERSGDTSLYRLLDFYCCYRAYVRGKVASIRLQAALSSQEHKQVQEEAKQCFALATRYASRLLRPLLIITTGLIGSGKSSLAAGVASALDLEIYSSDRIRKEATGLQPETPQRVAYSTGIYQASVSQETYATLGALARSAVEKGASVILDATYPTRSQRLAMASLATELGADFFVLECRAPEAVIRSRLEQRMRGQGSVSDGRWDIFPEVQKHYEPVHEIGAPHHVCLDAAQGVVNGVQQALAAIQKGRV